MILFKKKDDIQHFIAALHKKNKKIGFVPTMGALHRGHISLLQAARKKCDVVVCSIFVNPTQFNDKKDLEKYPRTIEKDVDLLLRNSCDALFYPDEATIYPEGTAAQKQLQLGTIEFILEGKFRPGHFQGVANVVSRLFDIIKPDEVFFGQKDLQQTKVIEYLISNNPGFQKIHLNIVPTLREPSMLAMSSRNTRLTPRQLEQAPAIYNALQFLKEHLSKGNLSPLLDRARQQLTAKGFRTEYITIVNSTNLEEVIDWDGHLPLTALAAAFLGDVRLIDNLELTD